MSAELLLQHFERISEAPDAIARLRRFILDLAVRGRLTAQDPNDEPAAELVKRIYARKTTTRNVVPKAERQGLMFDLPSGWISASFGDVFSLEYGDNLPAEKRSNSGEFPVYGSNGVVGSHSECFVRSPCIVVGRKGSAGALNLSLAEGCCVTDVAYYYVPPKEIDLLFAFKMFYTLRLENLGKGVKPGLSRSDAYALPIAIPPIAEQRRIAKKVDELMALCDQLAAAKAEREESRGRLVVASLKRLNQHDDEELLHKSAGFVLGNLARLTTRAEHIKQLRRTILNLSLRGKLVPQVSTDEPASALHRRLVSEITVFAAERGISTPKVDPVTEEAVPFSLPSGWMWSRLASLFKVITDGDHQPPPRAENGVAFLTIGNVTTGQLDFSNCRFVPQEYFNAIALHRRPTKGDFLYTVVGATYGRPALVDTDRPFCVQRHIGILRPVSEIDLGYLHLLLSSPLIYEQATRSLTGTAQPTIPLRPLRNFLAPLPPLAEQHRIVAKVAALMALCDQLEAQLVSTDGDNGRLLEAVLHEALATEALATAA